MKSVKRLLAELFGPTSRFRVGDSVELLQGKQIMVVIEIVSESGAENPHILCQWLERETNRPRTGIFREFELRPSC